MPRVRLLLLLVSVLVVATASAASAAPITRTEHSHTVQTVHLNFPCLGSPGQRDDAATVTFDTRETLHITAAGEGVSGDLIPPFHVHDTAVETVFVDPDNPTFPTYTGRDKVTIAENSTQRTYIFTASFTGQARGSDGSHFAFNSIFHITVNANGDTTVELFRFNCSNE